MKDGSEVAKRFYAAMHELDVEALRGTLADDFVLQVAAGLPGGLGGTHHGADAAMRDVWVPVFRDFACLPFPEEIMTVGPDRVVAVGEYRGKGPAGESFSAAFAHVIDVGEDGRLTRLRQITDTRSWPSIPEGT